MCRGRVPVLTFFGPHQVGAGFVVEVGETSQFEQGGERKRLSTIFGMILLTANDRGVNFVSSVCCAPIVLKLVRCRSHAPVAVRDVIYHDRVFDLMFFVSLLVVEEAAKPPISYLDYGRLTSLYLRALSRQPCRCAALPPKIGVERFAAGVLRLPLSHKESNRPPAVVEP